MNTKTRSSADLLGDAPTRGPGRPPGASTGKDTGRASTATRDRLNAAQARLAEIRADQLSGKLVLLSDVEARWAAAIVDCRQRLLALPARVATKCGMSRKHSDILEKEIRKALSELAASGGATPHAGKP